MSRHRQLDDLSACDVSLEIVLYELTSFPGSETIAIRKRSNENKYSFQILSKKTPLNRVYRLD